MNSHDLYPAAGLETGDLHTLWDLRSGPAWSVQCRDTCRGFWASAAEQLGIREALRTGGDERVRCGAPCGGDIQVKTQAPRVPWQMEEIKEAALSSVSSSVSWRHHRLPVRKNEGDVKCLSP